MLCIYVSNEISVEVLIKIYKLTSFENSCPKPNAIRDVSVMIKTEYPVPLSQYNIHTVFRLSSVRLNLSAML